MTEITPTPIERNALAEFALTPGKVASMAKEYLALKVPEGDTGAYKTARAALTLCVSTRTSTDKHRKQLGADARVWIKEVNSAAAELLEPLTEVEDHLRTELGREDGRKAKIKLEKEARELKRVGEIKEKIETIRSFSASLNWQLTVDELNTILGNLEVLVVTADEYNEFAGEATQIKSDVMIAIHKAIGAREVFDAEEAARKAEDERLAAEREEIEKRKAEQEARQKAIDEEQAKVDVEKKRLEEEEFKRKAKIQAEKDAAEKIRREKREKEEREKAEAEEKAKVEALKSDKEKLSSWFSLFVDALNADLYSVEHFKDDEAKTAFNTIFVQMERAIIDGLKRIEEL